MENMMENFRIEHDSMGEVKVPADKLWGAQTERSHENFEIGVGIETMPREITKAFGYLKKAAAIANNALKPRHATRLSADSSTKTSRWWSGRQVPVPRAT